MHFTLTPTHKRNLTKHDPTHFCLKNGIGTLSPAIAQHIFRCVQRGDRAQLFIVGFVQPDGSINIGIDIPKQSRFRDSPAVQSEPIATLIFDEEES